MAADTLPFNLILAPFSFRPFFQAKAPTTLLLFLALSFLCAPLGAETIGAISNDKIPIYAQIVENFKRKMVGAGHKIIVIDYAKDQEEAIAEGIKSSGCKYIFAVGNAAAKACNRLGYAGVFTMVVDPIQSGLINTEGMPTKAMTGIAVNVNPKTQFQSLKAILGNRTRVGIVYNPSVSRFMVSEYQKAAQEMGYEITESPVTDAEEVPAALETMKKKIDFLMAVVDNTVYNAKTAQVILKFSLNSKIPLVGFAPQQVKVGALIGFYCNYPKLGDQGAELMQRVITSDSSTISIQLPKDVDYALNKTTADAMKADFSSVSSGASETYGS